MANFQWSSKAQADCAEVPQGVYGSFNKWTAGELVPSSYRALTWTEKHANHFSVFLDTQLDYQLVYVDLFLSASYAAATEARAAQLCDFAVSNTITTSVVCDCLSSDQSCFSDSLVPTSVARPCGGSGTTLKYLLANIGSIYCLH
jgi:hypothetical protein